MKNVLITGRPGVGKTSVVEAVAREFRQVAGGFTTSEIRESGMRKGFRVTRWMGTQRCSPTLTFEGRCELASTGFDVPALEHLALPEMEDAVLRLRMVVIDEIGKMELSSKLFCHAVEKALDSPAIVLATVMERPHPFADQIKRRTDVVMFELTVQNRNELPGTITAKIRDELRQND